MQQAGDADARPPVLPSLAHGPGQRAALSIWAGKSRWELGGGAQEPGEGSTFRLLELRALAQHHGVPWWPGCRPRPASPGLGWPCGSLVLQPCAPLAGPKP